MLNFIHTNLKKINYTRSDIRNLHPTTKPNYIKDKLEKEVFLVRTLTKVQHRVSKKPLSLFLLI